MANEVVFEDYSIQVKQCLEDEVIAYLHEAGGEVVSQTQRNMDRLPGEWFKKQQGSWRYIVDADAKECIIGNPLEESIWTEFGTGEYALKGNGRKGGWIYFDEKRKEYRKTFGQSPKRPLFTAFNSLKETLIRRAEDFFKEL